ncbi:MAG: formate-dependent phosphoribosylglycinamide formyltransferase [Gammaproteobacteria bacterium]|nr:formate-dependent phosphoribosylglycinamide formyltransferase [Gammaproteobacteria bacterium]
MRIGTPLSPSATKVMLLGSGELGKEVIIELQRFGVEVIAVDRYDNAPGHQVAHRAYTINMADGTALRQLIEEVKPDLIVPEIEAIATDMLAEIEAEGLAEVIPTARATQLTMNREGIRRLAAEELGLATSAYAFADSLDELQAAIENGVGYPCIIKPVMSSSGKGQSRINSAGDVSKAWDYAMSGGRINSGRIIVEAVVEFDYEITLLTVRSLNDQANIITSYCQPIGHLQDKGDYVESWQPQAMSEAVLKKAQQMAEKVTTSLGGRGIFGVELFIKGDEVYFSEVSPRPHDTGLVTLMTQWQSEFALHARAILGLPVDTGLRDTGASAVIYGGMDEQGIAYENVDLALSEAQTEIRLFGKPESFIRRRMGVALAVSETTEAARVKAKKAAASVNTVAVK